MAQKSIGYRREKWWKPVEFSATSDKLAEETSALEEELTQDAIRVFLESISGEYSRSTLRMKA